MSNREWHDDQAEGLIAERRMAEADKRRRNEGEEAIALLRGCKAGDCPLAPGPLRWNCQCLGRIGELLARIDSKETR